ncbi:DNA sulfur modification protein DndE [Pedobacter terrae]|uniref:DNA sulfur modification protein DndE n=1 Tax=Pedobacter terrae TaxID=405671 RepID=A0A1G7Q4Y0_9SPHI|nr:DndE family protein [Pedobacter terrae]SDF93602.1 DNA sulfur modification protein DndE [Pedobacter terrae]
MFSNIKTSKANKEIVTLLTNKLALGSENVIARIALAYSLSQGNKLDVKDIADSGGKEYSEKVLFGDYTDYYVALICLHYGIYASDKDIVRYIKMHIDEGLQLLGEEFRSNHNTTGFEFIANKIDQGLLPIGL